MSTIGWGQPAIGKTSHFFVDGHSICGRAWYRESWDGTLTGERALGTRQCKRCIKGLVARGKKIAKETPK